MNSGFLQLSRRGVWRRGGANKNEQLMLDSTGGGCFICATLFMNFGQNFGLFFEAQQISALGSVQPAPMFPLIPLLY
jgi:hypothetical protein